MSDNLNSFLCIAGIAAVTAAPVHAQQTMFDLVAQPARTSIPAFGRQAQTQIIASEAATQDQVTHALQGRFEVRQALHQLLTGTELTVVADAGGVIVLDRAVAEAQPIRVRTQTIMATAAAAAPQPAPAPQLEEVIVTAQRRGENLQTVPVAVTAVTSADLQTLGVQSTTDLSVVAPSVTFAQGPGGGQVTVRGVGGTGSGGDEPANAVYLDGVYLPLPAAIVFDLSNIERVEVLKGPQGTLFGRNASGGLVQVITRAPSFEPDANAEVSYGNYDTTRLAGYVTGPLSPTLAVNVAGVYSDQREGWGRNVATGNDAYGGNYRGFRPKLLWEPGENTSVTLAGLFSRNSPASAQGASLLPGQFAINGNVNAGFYNTNTNIDSRNVLSESNYALTVRHDFGPLVLTSITSRDIVGSHLKGDPDTSAIPLLNLSIDGSVRTWTQELQLTSGQQSRVKWAAGLFYYDNDNTGTLTTAGLAVAPLPFSGQTTHVATKSYAAYGQATAPVTDSTNVTLGLRFTQDERDLTGNNFTNAGPTTAIANQTKTDEKFTWRFAVDQQLSERLLGYVSYSRGFKSGLFNTSAPTLPPVEPQTADTVEVGLKSELFDRRLRLNGAAFYNDIKALQVRGIFAGVTTPIFYNSIGARVKGVEAEARWLATENFTLQASASYMHGRYKNGFTNALAFTPRMGPPFGLAQSIVDASGNETVTTPEWASSLSARYVVPTRSGELIFAGSYSYNDGYYFDPQNRVREPSYNLVSANVEFHPTDQFWVRVWANNLTDDQYFSSINPAAFGDAYIPAAPRTYGVTVGFGVR